MALRSICWLAVIFVAIAPDLGKALMTAKTQALFDEPYRPDDSRHFKVQKSSTFDPEPSKQFDLSYADGTELKGFAGHDVVHVRIFVFFIAFAVPYYPTPKITPD
jgi:hypothetical protein